jgi:hypothetical protein
MKGSLRRAASGARGRGRRERRRWPAAIASAAMAVIACVPALAARASTSTACVARSTTSLLGDVTLTNWQPSGQGAANQCTPAPGATISGNWDVHFDASSVSSLANFSVAIFPMQDGIPPLASAATVARVYQSSLLSPQPQDTIAETWDTTSLTPYNGQYGISATATSVLGQQATTTVGKVLVNNPPATPTGVTVALSAADPVVTWSANTEPDLTNYQVLRSEGGPYSLVGTPTATRFDDSAVPTGTAVSYEVVAIRRSPVSASGIASAPSAPTAAVTPVAKPTAPATVASAPSSASKAPRVASAPALGSAGVNTSSSAFSATLPFGQQAPTATAADPSYPALGSQSLAGQQATTVTTASQKLRYVATALFLMVVAFLIIKYASRLIRGT